MKKKKGVTLLELVIVIAITLILLTIIVSVFLQNTRISSEVNIKSDLQTEAQNISRNISNSGMQASGITELTLLDNTKIMDSHSAMVEKNYTDITLVDETGVENADKDKNKWISIKDFTINEKKEETNELGDETIDDSSFEIMYTKFDADNKDKGSLSINGTTPPVSNNVESILIKPSNLFTVDNLGKKVKNGKGKISDATSMEVLINLAKKRGGNDIHYSIPTTVTFRNKAIN